MIDIAVNPNSHEHEIEISDAAAVTFDNPELKKTHDEFVDVFTQGHHRLARNLRDYYYSDPAPGGVGYGIDYKKNFRTAWREGTAIHSEYICPMRVGGDVDRWIYLTSTNRAQLGVEALIFYNKQKPLEFRIWDWALENKNFSSGRTLDQLKEYLGTRRLHGHDYTILIVRNYTYKTNKDLRWQNQVDLYNFTTNRFDRIYRSEYDSVYEQQSTGHIGTWGPIVETFQPRHIGVHEIGVANTQIGTREGNQWSFSLLTGAQSEVREDRVGFQRVFLDENYSFLVRC